MTIFNFNSNLLVVITRGFLLKWWMTPTEFQCSSTRNNTRRKVQTFYGVDDMMLTLASDSDQASMFTQVGLSGLRGTWLGVPSRVGSLQRFEPFHAAVLRDFTRAFQSESSVGGGKWCTGKGGHGGMMVE